MTIKRELQHSIFVVLKHNKDGSFATQANRKKILFQVAAELVAGGYQLRDIHSIKQKHIKYLVDSWKDKSLTVGTTKNRLACINWLCEKIDRSPVILSSAELRLEKRNLVANESKAITVDSELLNKITNEYVTFSLLLQREFGLRREEAIKIKPFFADQNDKLVLQGSWCKNGRPRTVPIRTTKQRVLLERCKDFLKSPSLSLIPKHKNYKQQLKTYEQQLNRAGIRHAHGLRHAYAQNLYKELTGWDCPVAGGKSFQEITKEEKTVDRQVRLIISEHLGHSRWEVVAQYLGK